MYVLPMKCCFNVHIEPLLTLFSNETVKFRVYELLVKVAGSSDKSFERAENEMLLAGLIAEVKSDDVLIKINAIEMFMEVWMIVELSIS